MIIEKQKLSNTENIRGQKVESISRILYENIYCLIKRCQCKWKNKILMFELKSCFTRLGYMDVVTYLNSGNIVF